MTANVYSLVFYGDMGLVWRDDGGAWYPAAFGGETYHEIFNRTPAQVDEFGRTYRNWPKIGLPEDAITAMRDGKAGDLPSEWSVQA